MIIIIYTLKIKKIKWIGTQLKLTILDNDFWKELSSDNSKYIEKKNIFIIF